MRHHRLGKADEAAILPIVDIDVAGLAGVQHGRHHFARLVARVDQHRRADVIEVPEVMRNVLEVADVFAGVQIHRDQRVGVEIVAGTHRTVEVGRRIADHKVDAVRRLVDRGVLPHAAAEGLVGIAVLGQRVLLGRNVAVLVSPGRVGGRPDADRALRDRVSDRAVVSCFVRTYCCLTY